jgi:transcriptional regulator with XRE-family HTH domain
MRSRKDWAERVEEQTFLKELGRQVRVLRREKNLTQAELGEQAGSGLKYVGEVERGRTNPTARLVWRLSRALEREVFELFLFSVSDEDQDRILRTQLVRLLKDRKGKELKRVVQILRLVVE